MKYFFGRSFVTFALLCIASPLFPFATAESIETGMATIRHCGMFPIC